MNLDTLGWVGTGLVVYGVWKLAKHSKKGFIACSIGDVILGIQGLLLGMPSLVALNVVLLYINIVGFRTWKRIGV